MEIKELEAIIEAILFAAGDEVSINTLSEIIEIDKKTIQSVIKRMIDTYNYERRGFQIIEIENCYQLCTRAEYHTYVKKLIEPQHQKELSVAALETLAIIAYNQPVTRSDIESIRGINSDSIVNNLVIKGLIEEVGRLDTIGRPIIYGTTRDFLRCFGLKNIEDLPDINIQEKDNSKIQ